MTQDDKIDIFIQRNKDRTDFDTLVGVFADKFNVDRVEAEEIIMRKTKKVNEKYDWLEKEISLEGKIKGEDYIISFSPYMFNNTYQVEILKKENGVLEIVFSKNNARGGSVEQIFASIFNFFNLPMPKTNDLSSGLNVNIMIDTLINRYDFNLKENNKKGDNIMRKVEKKVEEQIEAMRYMDKILSGYLDAALFTAMDEELYNEFDSSEFNRESIEKAKQNINLFLNEIGNIVTQETLNSIGQDWYNFGMDLWMTQTGQGVGFWESEWEPIGEQLYNAVQKLWRQFSGEMVFRSDDGNGVILESKRRNNIIEVEREVKIGDVILEKGDRIRVIKERDDAWIVYIKGQDIKRWMPMGESGPVINLMHAVMFDNKEDAERDAEELKRENPDYDFQVRNKG